MSVTGEENYWSRNDSDALHYAHHRPPYAGVAVPWIVDYYRSCHGTAADLDKDVKIPLAVDVGCGPGSITQMLGDHCTRVIGVDISEDMLAVARRERVRPNVDYVRGSALDLVSVCGEHTVDLLVAGTAVHLFNGPKFYAEAERVLKPNGVLAIVAYLMRGFRGSDDLTNVVEDFLKEQMVDEKVSQIMQLLYDRYKTLGVPFPGQTYRVDFFEAEMTRENVYGALMATSDWIKDGPDRVEQFVNGLTDTWPLTMLVDLYGVFVQMKGK